MKLLSIIVPVYNVEKYLGKCLDSLIAQNLKPDDYEIIIINDESTDKSLAIAQDYAIKYPNLIIINQKNKGLGGARNTGIKHAKGKYTIFVDSDDYIESNCLKGIIAQMENKNLDAIRFNYQSVDEQYQVINKSRNTTYNVKFDSTIVDGETFLSTRLGWACYVVMFIFKTEILQKNALFFNESIYYEDVEWLPRVFQKIKKIHSINLHVYYYLRRSGSITKSVSTEKKNKVINDKLFIIDLLAERAKKATSNNVAKWMNAMNALTIFSLLSYTAKELPTRKKEIVDKVFVEEKYKMQPYHFTVKQKRDLMIIRLSPYLYMKFKTLR